MKDYYESCRLCPRDCGADRHVQSGICGCGAEIRAARAGLHYYEEPFLSGTNGSGTVFFSGCSLGCIYCQNGPISREMQGKDIPVERLAEIFLEQQERNAHNLNLVTGTHFTPKIVQALQIAKGNGLSIPVVWNSSGYEKPETLRMLEGYVDIFLPDFKTLSPELGRRYMKASDYPEWAKKALACMVEMTGDAVFQDLPVVDPEPDVRERLSMTDDGCFEKKGQDLLRDEQNLARDSREHIATSEVLICEGEDVLMTKGVVVRHLLIPGQTGDTKAVLRYLHETYGDHIWISLMSQYTPVGAFAARSCAGEGPAPGRPETGPMTNPDMSVTERNIRALCPELCRTVSAGEYDEVVDYAISLGIENCMIQEGEVASDSFIPEFDGTGI